MTEETTIVSPIETALAKENVTNQVIQKLKDNYLGLKINGIEDKAGFKAVEEARKECKSVRTLAVKICKKGREDAIQIQKEWIAKEKEVVASIEEVEGYLESQSNEIKELEKQILFEAAQKAKLPARKEKLASIDIEVNDDELLKIDDTQFGALFNEFYEKHLADKAEKLRLENERIAAEKAEEERLVKIESDRLAAVEKARIEAENKRLREEAETKEKELAAERLKQEEERKKIEAEAQRKIMEIESKAKAEREAAEKKAAEEKAKQDAIIAKQKEDADKLAMEVQAEKDRQAEIEKARIVAENKAAKAPIKQQLNTWVDSFSLGKPISENDTTIDIEVKFESFKKWAKTKVEEL